MDSEARSTVVSCPGKVLFAGGYLVLDRDYRGLVVATASRFYTVVRPLDSVTPRVVVRSPQFVGAVWAYDTAEDGTATATEECVEGLARQLIAPAPRATSSSHSPCPNRYASPMP